MKKDGCAAYHKGQRRALPWEPDCEEGKTMGCSVSEEGKFRLIYNGTEIDDVVWTGLPTDKPLWGFVLLRGYWKVEADYDVATPNGEPVGGLACLLSLVVGLAFPPNRLIEHLSCVVVKAAKHPCDPVPGWTVLHSILASPCMLLWSVHSHCTV